jgi:hypothetical protein
MLRSSLYAGATIEITGGSIRPSIARDVGVTSSTPGGPLPDPL